MRRQTYHEERSNEPIYGDAETNLNPNSSFSKNVMKCFVFDFAEDGVHHDKKADRCND